MDFYGVMGYPIQHSKSPYLHQLFAEQTRQCLTYSALLVAPHQLSQALTDFQSSNGLGLNITSPLKQLAFELMDNVSMRAERAKAINTISFKEGKRYGDTTDGIGLVRDIVLNKKINLADKKILILGAGGATWSILESILAENPCSVTIANRSINKAIVLANAFSDLGYVIAQEINTLEGDVFDMIIHATSAGIQDAPLELPAALCCHRAHCYDLNYGKELSSFLTWAKTKNAFSIHNGWGMLVEQAAESFQIWRGVKPMTQMFPDFCQIRN